MIYNKKARSLVVIMMVIAVSAFVLRFGLIKAIRINISYNETVASSTLKLISVALENYAKNNKGFFPASIFDLTRTKPPYLDKDYSKQFPLKGYNYSCPRVEPSGYSCSASPTRCKLTGDTVYNITTGGVLVTEECNRKD